MSKSRTRRNGEGTIRQRTDGRWEVRISGGIDFATGHKMRVSRYASTEEEAVQALNQLRVQFGSSRRKVSPMLLGEWLDFWLQTYMISSLKQSTYASYQTYARVHFKPALGEVPLKSLSTRILQQFYNYKFEEEGLSPKSIRNMNLYLHKALSQALQEGLIDSNPASGVTLPRARRPQVEILTRDDQAKLVRATYHHRYGVFVRLVLMTGLRMGELLGLRWEDIDFHSNMLHIQRTLNRLQKRDLPDTFSGNRTEIVIQEPKTENSIRTIPLLPQLIKDLMTWRSLQEMDRAAAGEQYQDTGMIVTNPMGGYIEPRTFKKYYDQILEIARLRHFTFHALRHTFASRAMEQGMDAKTLSTLLGHYSVSFTLDTYAHVLNDQKWEGMQLMEDLYHLGEEPSQTAIYPVIVSFSPAGYQFNVPDLPEIDVLVPTVETGVATVKDQLEELLSGMPFQPPASTMAELDLEGGQFVVQVQADAF